MKVIIAGDFCDNYRVSEVIKQEKYSFLFDEVAPVIKDSDFSIVNFEFPIDSNSHKPITKCGPTLKGQTNAIKAIKYAGFNVCTLANNHILDQGYACCLETKQKLETFGIKTVGVGKDLCESGNILYLKKNSQTLAIINCCENEFSIATEKTPGANPLNSISQYYKIKEAKDKADYVLVIVHGGHEMCQLPSPRMKALYRFFIDAGADAVVNHHQHCYSGHETYKEKSIIYGLGNFLFDWECKQNQIWNEGYMVAITFDRNQQDIDLIPFTQCNDEPRVSLISGEGRKRFDESIRNLNNIIRDDFLLEQKYKSWILSNKGAILTIFQPYNNFFLRVLFNKGLLPSFITKRKKFQIINYITCESHLDKLRILINNIR